MTTGDNDRFIDAYAPDSHVRYNDSAFITEYGNDASLHVVVSCLFAENDGITDTGSFGIVVGEGGNGDEMSDDGWVEREGLG